MRGSGGPERRERLAAGMAMAFALAIFCFRIVHLDQDLPPWGISYYQPIDEGSYSILALNLVNYGAVNVGTEAFEFPSYTPPHVRVNVFGNALTYLSLEILGKNYIGSRFPSFLWAAGIVVLLILTMRRIDALYGPASRLSARARLWIPPIAVLSLALDFTFLVASRVVEPSIVRAFFNLAVLYAYLALRDRPAIRFAVLGALATLSVFFVYITNVFIFLPCAVAVVAEARYGLRRFAATAAWFAAGVAIGFCAVEPYYRLVWDTSSVANLFSAMFDFRGTSGYEIHADLRNLVKNASSFLGAGVFLYNPALLPLSVGSLAVNLALARREKGEIGLFTACAALGLFLQSLASNDYIMRKNLVLQPYYLAGTLIAIYRFGDFRALIEYRARRPAVRWSILAIAGLFVAAQAYAIRFRLFRIKNDTILDFEDMDRFLLVAISALCVAALGAGLFAFRRDGRIGGRRGATLLLVALAASAAPGVYFSAKYVYADRTYTEKQVMLDLGALVGDSYVFGEYENGFSLYNDMKPVLNTYERIGDYMCRENARYYFDYYFEGAEAHAYFHAGPMAPSRYAFVPLREFKRDFKTFGLARSVALYEKVPKFFEWASVRKVLSSEEDGADKSGVMRRINNDDD